MTHRPRHLRSPLARRALLALPVAACVGLSLVGCTSSGSSGSASSSSTLPGGITVDHLTIDAPANPTTSVLRMQVHNGDPTDDALVAVTTPVAAGASIHRTVIDGEGRSSMAPATQVAIPARSTVTFAPDGLHVMVTGVERKLVVGQEVPVTLTFRKAGDVTAKAEVVPPGSTQEDHDGH